MMERIELRSSDNHDERNDLTADTFHFIHLLEEIQADRPAPKLATMKDC